MRLYLQKSLDIVDDTGVKTGVDISVSEPKKSEQANDYFCLVEATPLIAGGKKIYGVNEEQALKVSFEFLNAILKDKKILDKDGNPYYFSLP